MQVRHHLRNFSVFIIHDIIWQFEIQTFILFFADFHLKSLSFLKYLVSLNCVFRYFRSKMFKFSLAFSSLIRIFAIKYR